MSVEGTLHQRSSTHGDFAENARTAQALKNYMHSSDNWLDMSSTQQEALENICQKIARILVGNPNHADNWHDIAGYATLAEKELKNV